MNSQNAQILETFVLAAVFGVFYGLVFSFTPLEGFFRPVDCWDSQDDFWGSKNQLALVFCAALSFFVLSFLKTDGWKGFLKTCAVSYLCFQIFTLTSIYDSIYTQHCLFPRTIADAPKKYLIGFAIVGLIISAIATGIFTALRSVFKRFMALLFPVKNEFTDLDLNKK